MGRLYSPAQCRERQVNYTCDDPNDVCLHVRTSYRSVTTEKKIEVEFKGCASRNDREYVVNKICARNVKACKHSCCLEDLCNNNISKGDGCLQCFHCNGPDEGLVFNHSTPLNISYTKYQCIADQTVTTCPNGHVCGIVSRHFQGFEVRRHSCISDEHCKYLQKLCHGNSTARNDTFCQAVCCHRDLCNSTSCVNLTLLFIVLTTLFGVISV